MWAAAPVTGEFKALEDRLKLSRSMDWSCEVRLSDWSYMSRYISTVYVKCRNGSLKAGPNCSGYSPGAIGSDINLRV